MTDQATPAAPAAPDELPPTPTRIELLGRVETGRKRVRALLAGHVVADTSRPLLVWENPYFPAYYIPAADVHATLAPTGATAHSAVLGEALVHDVTAGGVTAAGAARTYPDSPLPAVRGAVRLDWDAMDDWLEENEPVYVHPRSPYARIDILSSSRHVRVEVDGVTIADSRSPHILFETGLPPRYYLPLSDLRIDLLQPSDTVTRCPYKGTATYWSVRVNGRTYPDLVWMYRTPLPESQKIAGLAACYDEKVDVYLDGVRQQRPGTKFT